MDGAVTLVHLSDLHLSDPSGAGLAPVTSVKRLLAYLSWRLKKRHRHDPAVLEAAARDIDELAADAVVVTGDLTHLGLPQEYRQVRDWLPALGEPLAVSIVPGNHDATRPSAWEDGLGQWEPWFSSNGAGAVPDRATAFPSVRLEGDVALIGVSTARPSSPLLAVGSIGDEQLGRLRAALAEHGRAGRFRVVFMHHPPAEGIVGWRKRLTDLDRLGEVLAAEGVELLLHGHSHHSTCHEVTIAGRRVPVVGAPATSESRPGRRRGGTYNVYRIERGRDDWELAMSARAWSAEDGRFVDAGALATRGAV